MSTLTQKLRVIRAKTHLFENDQFDHFRAVSWEKSSSEPPRYLQRALAQLEYAHRLTLANKELDAAPVEKAADIAYNAITAYGMLPPADAQAVEEALLPLADAAKKYTVHMVSHAHIDMNWRWPWHETVSITLETFRTMLKLMEEYPDFTYSQSQASVYEIVEKYEPEMLEVIKQRIREGRWEVTASTWVEADKNMPNLESMAHHLLYTKEYLSKLLDIDPATLDLDYEPDTFGHSENVPEILSKGGVKYYYHCRGNEQESIYNWEAPSGARVLAIRDHTWYLGDITPNFALYVPEYCEQCGIDRYLRVYGVGDHGGGPTRRDLDFILDMQTWPVYPKLVFSTYKAFYDYLWERRETFPVVRHELNPVFTGCYTSQSRTKMANRIGEATLSEAQALSAAASVLVGKKTNERALQKGWRNILFNQFHDILPGSGVRDTREHAMTNFSETMALAGTEYAASMRAIAEKIDTSRIEVVGSAHYNNAEGGGVGFGAQSYAMPVAENGGAITRIFHLFNPAAQERTENVKITVWDWRGDLSSIAFADDKGNALECELLTPVPMDFERHLYIEVLVRATVPALGYATIVMNEGEVNDTLPLPVDPRLEKPDDYTLENEYICAKFDGMTGQMVSLKDKATGREYLSAPAGFRYIEEDCARGMVSWLIGRYMKREPLQYVKISEYKKTALRTSFVLEAPFGQANKVKATVYLDKGKRNISMDTHVWLNDIGTMADHVPQLAFAAPLSYVSSKALYDTPAGAIVRDAVNLDLPASTFMAALDDEGGLPLTLATDSKYGFRCYGNEAQVTLVRDACDPDPYSDRGEHDFRINIHVEDDLCPRGIARRVGYSIRPIHSLSGGKHAGELPASLSFAQVGMCPIRFSGMKVAQDGKGLLLRLFDMVGKGAVAPLTFALPPKKVTYTDILEKENFGEAVVEGNLVKVDVQPGAVVNIRVEF